MFRKSVKTGARRRGWLATLLLAISPAAAIVAQFVLADVAAAAPITTACGSLINSIVKTNVGSTVIGSTNFAAIPGASAVVSVPAGNSRCIKVTFTASTFCTNGGENTCTVNARDSGALMNPQQPFRIMDLESFQTAAHSLEWVRRVSAGNHVIAIHARVSSPTTDFESRDWTMDVQVLN
jgi:hypothetical protein